MLGTDRQKRQIQRQKEKKGKQKEGKGNSVEVVSLEGFCGESSMLGWVRVTLNKLRSEHGKEYRVSSSVTTSL